MITESKTEEPIINVYKSSDVKSYHLKPNTKPTKIYYFDKNTRNCEGITLNNSFVLPYNKGKFFRYLISGASGSGKTTLLSNICTQFMYDNNNKGLIIYISSLLYDKYLDEVFKKIGHENIIKLTHKNFIKNNPLIQVKTKTQDKKNNNNTIQTVKNELFDNNILKFQKKEDENDKKKKNKDELLDKLDNTPFINLDTLREFIDKYYPGYEVLVCFDDTLESMPSTGNFKIIKAMIMELQHAILTAGRAHRTNEKNINGIFILHNAISGQIPLVRTFINESNYLCLSLRATPKSALMRLCDKQGFNDHIDTLLKMKSEGKGMIFMSCTYPFYILSDDYIKLIE